MSIKMRSIHYSHILVPLTSTTTHLVSSITRPAASLSVSVGTQQCSMRISQQSFCYYKIRATTLISFTDGKKQDLNRKCSAWKIFDFVESLLTRFFRTYNQNKGQNRHNFFNCHEVGTMPQKRGQVKPLNCFFFRKYDLN